jgi:glycerol kinase
MPTSRDALVLAIDQGTTSSRSMLFDRHGRPRASAQLELPQAYPQPGWVEHDAMRIWSDTLKTMRGALRRAKARAEHVLCIGITNQRETTVLWDRRTGKPVHPAIVWQDRRTADACEKLAAAGLGRLVSRRTGLLLDPYFSATKLAWLLDQVTGARAAAEAGHLAFGTIDSWLLWNLTGGRVHATDATNAARTMLFDIHKQRWDKELLARLDIPPQVLPEVRDSSGAFGATDAKLLGRAIPITGIAGDQQAATFGQAAFQPGMIKSTYGTGCFVVLNTGGWALASKNRLLTTVGWRLDGKVTYALEGSIFVAGATVQWLRDGLKAFRNAADSEAIAKRVPDTGGVYLVPAFTGLGAPHWDAHARGALIGMTRDTGLAQIVRAGLEAVCFQTRDLMQAMASDGAAKPIALRVDGGMARNDWLMQMLADILDVTVERPKVTETTALGAAYLAGLSAGLYPSTEAIAKQWQRDRAFTPRLSSDAREAMYAGWQGAVARVLTRKTLKA